MKTLTVSVASKNPAKIDAVSAVLEKLQLGAEIVPVDAGSGVSAQPFSLEETRQGAVNRAQAALLGKYDLAFGLEGGVYVLEESLYLCNWGALATKEGRIYTAAGAQLPLPERISEQLRAGRELGPVMDEYAGEIGIRHHKGAIGILTSGLVKRNEMFEHIVELLAGQFLKDSD
ncbi:Non-canonical purine NTP phosphatase [Planococcus massiliensis]|uniref:inosine/xanthosine triphosphatase n=1 Tax=Planococcus massiliensis TaxID=1499687 RepID=A0A098ELV5_9BACL|nr:DUF84 family protein [Planococcus massiliensis]CEG23299.1 Non-canonical purine NTP phosphatase [Planococcus massiliensis]